jgi:predicted small secreted protein
MVAGSLPARKPLLALLALLSSLWLAACETTAGLGGPSINTGAAVPVALLVPQTGPGDAPALSRSLENAARLAMGDLQGARIDLRVYDTGGQPQQSAAAAVQAVQDGAKIIIGPVFAQDAAAAGRAVAPRGINVLSFSNNPAVAGGNVFVLGNTFDNTANRLVRYAVSRGRGDILIAHAQDASEETGATRSSARSRPTAPRSPASRRSSCRSRASSTPSPASRPRRAARTPTRSS